MNKIILIIENDFNFLQRLSDKLIISGFVVMTAEGKKGLDKALVEKPSLILIDEVVEDTTAFALIQSLRKDPWGRDVPIFVMSDKSEIARMVKEVDSNYDYFLKSKTPIDTIVDKVKKKLHYE